MPKLEDVVGTERSYYVLQCRRKPTDPWLLYADDREVYEDSRRRITELVATAVWDAVRYFYMSYNDYWDKDSQSSTIHGIPTIEKAMLALVLVHSINPSPYQWRLARRYVRVKVYDDPIDHREFTTKWRESIPYVGPDEPVS